MITIQGVLIFSLLPLLYTAWVFQVNTTVPAPYLDEVFHARQAQAYCAGQFGTWDPKITTPPGLYIVSYLFIKTKQLVFNGDCCDLRDLRWLNSLTATYVIPYQLWDLYGQLGLCRRHGQNEANISHNIVNICLFPLFLFFSGLYYTDVCSVSFVLGAYQYHVRSLHDASTPRRTVHALGLFVLGIGALLMRQTNIFWVAIFFAGLQAVHQVKRLSLPRSEKKVKPLLVTEAIHDPPVSDTYLENYIKTAFSLARAAMRHPTPLLLSLWPYLALLALFATFVLVNGGVVLGDKENHIASIHLPQMLYIWPYIVFFSWPVILPHILQLLSETKALESRLPRPVVAILIMALMTLTVHFNTIIHPFTLADNRHYVFYVFRLLRHPVIKYTVVPVYFISAWAALIALENGHPPPEKGKQQGSPHLFSAEINPPPSPLRTSFVFVFLISTTLSLISAPLVEPRYFILPWLIWRLHVVQPPPPARPQQSQPTWAPPLLRHTLQPHSSTWLYIETAWFLFVNLATCYMFVYKGFAWKQEPGKVQRFMW